SKEGVCSECSDCLFVRPQKRPTPYPLILVSLGKSRTRRVPAPSRLAQRDVAKTHVSPGPCPRGSWREAQIPGHFYLADVSIWRMRISESTTPKFYSIWMD